MEATKNRRCRLAIDGHVLLQKEKTGIGQTAQCLINELVKNRDFDVQINFVDFLGYRCRKLVKQYKAQGCRIKFCWWLPYSIYAKLFDKFKIPYSVVFGKRNDITLFFEYRVPYGVGTMTANYVYDVNYKVYPETVDEKTLKWLDGCLPTYCKRSDIVITISKFSKKEIEKYLDMDACRIWVVPCGVDCEKFNRKSGISRIDKVKRKYGINGKYILYMGTLEPRKNIALLIEAYHILTENMKGLPKLVIAGKKGWMYEKLFQMVSDFELENEVVFTGYIEENDSSVLMAGAELFVFPSLYEGFGIPPLEAMACGTPVIVSDTEALLEATGECAVVFRSGDTADLSDKIKELLQDGEKKKQLSVAGLNRAAKYTWKIAGEKLEDVFRYTLTERTRSQNYEAD